MLLLPFFMVQHWQLFGKYLVSANVEVLHSDLNRNKKGCPELDSLHVMIRIFHILLC